MEPGDAGEGIASNAAAPLITHITVSGATWPVKKKGQGCGVNQLLTNVLKAMLGEHCVAALLNLTLGSKAKVHIYFSSEGVSVVDKAGGEAPEGCKKPPESVSSTPEGADVAAHDLILDIQAGHPVVSTEAYAMYAHTSATRYYIGEFVFRLYV